MMKRLEYWIDQVSDDYKYGIVCGGLNDMADADMEIPKVVANLKNICTIMTETLNCEHVFLLTIPITLADEVYEDYRNKKSKINNLIRDLTNGENIHLVDIAKLINLCEKTKEEQKVLWDDHLHFTIKGYDLMAKHIFGVMKKVLLK